MPDALSIADLEQQYPELLPAQVVLSLFCFTGSSGTPGAGQGYGGTGYNIGNCTTGHQTNISSMGFNSLPGTAYHW
jgi:hypothetical protein